MKVRIIKSCNPDWWYSNKIGEIYEVSNINNREWEVTSASFLGVRILKEDAEVVEDIEKSCDNCLKQNKDRELHCGIKCYRYGKWQPIQSIENDIGQATGTTEEAKHYQVAEVQPIEVMQMYLTPEEMIGGLKWQVIKYILRIGHKGSDREDAGKCNQYSQWLCDAMDEKIIVPGGK